MNKLLCASSVLSLILLSSFVCAMDDQRVQPAPVPVAPAPVVAPEAPAAAPAPVVAPEAPAAAVVPPALIELRGRYHQGWRQIFRLSRNAHAAYTGRLSQFSRPIGRILAWGGTIFGGYKSYTWYNRSKPTTIRCIKAWLGGIASFIGSTLAGAFISFGLPGAVAAVRHRADIREIFNHQRNNYAQAGQLINEHQMDFDGLNNMIAETKDAALGEEDADYRATTIWRYFDIRAVAQGAV